MQLTATPDVEMTNVRTVDIGTTVRPKSFEAFYAESAPAVARALAVTLNDDQLAADATNEAMTRAFQKWSKISAYENPAGWAYRVGLNWSLSWRQRRRRERDQPMATAGGGSVDAEPRDDSLDAALSKLSVEHRAVVVCRIHLDWSVEQTAEALDIAPGTVKSRLARALDQLRTAMAAATSTGTTSTGTTSNGDQA